MITGSVSEVFVAFLRLGLTAFGGPVAHLGYFRTAFVVRRRWLDETAFADLVALCSFLPGPTSSQTGVAIGLRRAGWGGALAAWVGFTLPSAGLMTGFALFAANFAGAAGAIHGLKLAAVAIVAHAVIGMARSLTPDWPRRAVALVAAAVVALGPAGQIGAIVIGAVAGIALGPDGAPPPPIADVAVSRRVGAACLTVFVALLAGLPWLHDHGGTLALAGAFFRAGALVFGGGHVVLPLLRAALVPTWIGGEAFLAGYGAAQALPGPLFSFAAYLGAAIGGAGIAMVALVALFLPGMLLLFGVLPFWATLRRRGWARAAVQGVNAAVVGLLAAALVSPVATGAIGGWGDAALATAGLAALLLKAPPWSVVAGLVAAASA